MEGILGVYQVDQVYDVMSGVQGGQILGSLVGVDPRWEDGCFGRMWYRGSFSSIRGGGDGVFWSIAGRRWCGKDVSGG